MPSLFVAISGHGFGHLSQIAPVVNELARRHSQLRLTIQSALHRSNIESRILYPFDLIREAPDAGMVMAGPMTLLADASLHAHEVFHATWEERVRRQQMLYRQLSPKLVLADVPYLPLEAARREGVPSAALCSLNWADILSAYCSGEDAESIVKVMRSAYAAARMFVRAAPAMPMSDLPNGRSVGPIAALGINRRAEIAERLGIEKGARLILVSFGGIEPDMDHRWPRLAQTHWLLPASCWIGRPDCHAIEALGLPFLDLLSSVDVVVTKPGYGTFTEAACNGTPVAYAARPDWPESPYLEAWLHENGRAVRLSIQDLLTGGLREAVAELIAAAPKPCPEPTGAAQAADLLEVCLWD